MAGPLGGRVPRAEIGGQGDVLGLHPPGAWRAPESWQRFSKISISKGQREDSEGSPRAAGTGPWQLLRPWERRGSPVTQSPQQLRDLSFEVAPSL